MGNSFLSDFAFWGYGINSGLYLYLFLLFFWWAIKTEFAGCRISCIWIYLLLLFGTSGYQTILSAIARFHRSNSIDDYFEFMASGIWVYRMYFVGFVLLIIAVHMSYRAFYLRKRIRDNDC